MQESAHYRLINIDQMVKETGLDKPTHDDIETWVGSLSFKTFDFLEKRLPFVLDLKTDVPATWAALALGAKQKYWVSDPGFAIVVFGPNELSGTTRTYRFSPHLPPSLIPMLDATWPRVRDEKTLYGMLDTPSGRAAFDAWFAYQSKVTELPTEFVSGRLANTGVEKTWIFSRGAGCVECGAKAEAYAATTIGRTDDAVLAHLPLCREHLDAAKAHPSVLHFLASIFRLSLDLGTLVKMDSIPDEVIPVIHEAAAHGLGGSVGSVKHRDRGWELRIPLASGWSWLLRVNTFMDFAYMLYEPGGKQRYRADSAPDHKDVPFFPMHQHSRPDSKAKDEVTPSFLYGHPLLDMKRLKAAGREYGAY